MLGTARRLRNARHPGHPWLRDYWLQRGAKNSLALAPRGAETPPGRLPHAPPLPAPRNSLVTSFVWQIRGPGAGAFLQDCSASRRPGAAPPPPLSPPHTSLPETQMVGTSPHPAVGPAHLLPHLPGVLHSRPGEPSSRKTEALPGRAHSSCSTTSQHPYQPCHPQQASCGFLDSCLTATLTQTPLIPLLCTQPEYHCSTKEPHPVGAQSVTACAFRLLELAAARPSTPLEPCSCLFTCGPLSSPAIPQNLPLGAP